MSLVFPNLQSVFTKKAKKSCLNIRSFIRVIKASNSDRSNPPTPTPVQIPKQKSFQDLLQQYIDAKTFLFIY